ncbi:MAG: metal ABC transporter ATP-binding protein [Clostridia bacterium]|nr:metal ABC transporter ATP-binding protein [Clostridia bacterium]
MPILSCRDVSLSYDGSTVVSGLSFDVNPGDYLCIVGENGSGKSTLTKALLGLMKVSGGSSSAGEGLSRNQIGYLPQQTDIQKDFPASVEEVVLSGTLGSMAGRLFYSKKEKALAREKMELLGLAGMEKRCYQDLSGGQQQRVLLARALCASEKLLILDEPAAGLDPLITADLYSIVKKLNREHGITVIMVSHDLAAAIKDSTHILHLRRGPLFFGTTADYIKSGAAKTLLGGVAL